MTWLWFSFHFVKKTNFSLSRNCSAEKTIGKMLKFPKLLATFSNRWPARFSWTQATAWTQCGASSCVWCKSALSDTRLAFRSHRSGSSWKCTRRPQASSEFWFRNFLKMLICLFTFTVRIIRLLLTFKNIALKNCNLIVLSESKRKKFIILESKFLCIFVSRIYFKYNCRCIHL